MTQRPRNNVRNHSIDAGKNIQLIRFCGWVNFRRIKARKEEEILIKFKKNKN